MSNEERKEQLLKNIENWEKELNEVWRDTNTDAAEVERRNLRNLIYNARSILKLKTTHMLSPMGLVPYSAI